MHLLDSFVLAIVASTPLLLAVEGELLVQRSGIINLGIEGMMLTAAMTSVVFAQFSGSTIAGFAGGIAGAGLMAALFGIFAIVLTADQIVTGTAINLLALGVTGFVYREMQSRELARGNGDVVVIVAWIVVILTVAAVWKFVDYRNQPPPVPQPVTSDK